MTDRTDPVVEARHAMAPRPTDPIEAAIFDALMTRGVWERHLRGGHAIDASHHARELAIILAATLDTARAAVPEPSVREAAQGLVDAWDEMSERITKYVRDDGPPPGLVAQRDIEAAEKRLRAALTDPSKPDEPA